MEPHDQILSPTKFCICGNPACTVPWGFCHCLCGGETKIATRTWFNVNARVGWPMTYINGHQRRIRPVYADEPPFYIEGEPCRWIIDSAGNKYAVDVHRFLEFSRWQWFPSKCGLVGRFSDTRRIYAVRRERVNGKDHSVALHNEVLKPPLGRDADHKNHNPFDNRLSNLRPATHIQQSWNTLPKYDKRWSPYKGVSKRRYGDGMTFFMRIKYYSLVLSQNFVDEIDAAIAYDIAASILYEEFAYLNFPARVGDPPWAAALREKCHEVKRKVIIGEDGNEEVFN
jgi:hypothetical protein